MEPGQRSFVPQDDKILRLVVVILSASEESGRKRVRSFVPQDDITKKKQAEHAQPVYKLYRYDLLENANVLSLGAFGSVYNTKLDSLVFFQTFETVADDGAIVNEDILLTTLAGNKPITFFAIEPFNGSDFSC